MLGGGFFFFVRHVGFVIIKLVIQLYKPCANRFWSVNAYF